MKTFVTGASGFIGSAIVNHLLHCGHEVRVMVRPDSLRTNLDGLPVEFVVGDLTDPSSLKKAIKGCNVLFHVGAYYRLWSSNPDEFYSVNVKGTRDIMLAALAANVERIVYTSSIAALGSAPEGQEADENTPFVAAKGRVIHYKRSKFLAECEVKNLIRDEGLPAVIVNPTAPVGPRDIKPTPTGRMIREAAAGKIPAYVNTGLNIVHVDDIAIGHQLAFESGVVGERYILGSENMSLKDILEHIAELTGQSPPYIRLAPNLVLPIAYVSEYWAKLTNGAEPMATVDGIRLARKCMYFSCAKARRELGYSPRPAKEALADAVAWFQESSATAKQTSAVSLGANRN